MLFILLLLSLYIYYHLYWGVAVICRNQRIFHCTDGRDCEVLSRLDTLQDISRWSDVMVTASYSLVQVLLAFSRYFLGATSCFMDSMDIHTSMKHVWAPPLMKVQQLRRFKHGEVIEISDGIFFVFYKWLPHLSINMYSDNSSNINNIRISVMMLVYTCNINLQTSYYCGLVLIV